MMRSLIRTIDSLFYIKAVTTHRVTKQTYSDFTTISEIMKFCQTHGKTIIHRDDYIEASSINVPSKAEDRFDVSEQAATVSATPVVRRETVVVANESQFVLAGKVIDIPENIRNLAPANTVDIAHFHAFPIDKSTTILVMSEEPGRRYTAHYGLSPDEENFILHSDSDIRSILDDLIDKSGTDEATVAMAQHGDVSFTSVIYDEWDFLIANIKDVSRICVAIPNQRDEMDFAQDNLLSATAACTFARAILLALRTTGKLINHLNEHDLRSAILALLLVDRSASE